MWYVYFMKTAIILHGMCAREEFEASEVGMSQKHWLPWLQMRLAGEGFVTQVPDMPTPYAPDYSDWLRVLAQFSIDSETMLVGHSLGAGFLVRWLSENEVAVGKVALVAPYLNADDPDLSPGWFDFALDRQLVKKTAGVSMFWSSEDDSEILESVKQLKSIENIELLELPGKGHFTRDDMGTEEFPEILEWLTA